MHKTRSFRIFLAAPLKALPLLLLPAALSGCGFQPLYGNQDATQVTTAEDELRRVYVASIPERNGQLLRLALQSKMNGAGPENPDGYTLIASPGVGQEALDIHSDNTSGRVRINATAYWKLYTVAQNPVLLAEGSASAMDGITPSFEQYFAQTMNTETATARVMNTLGERITQQVAIWFKTHTKPAVKRNQGPKTYYPSPNAMPSSEQQAPMEEEGADAIPDMATGRTKPDAGSL